MPKVLHVNDYPSDTGGGTEVYLARTTHLLRAAGWDVATFTTADLPDDRLTPWRYLDNRIARRTLRAQLEQFRPHVVHLHNFYHVLSPGILAELSAYRRSRTVRVVMTAHDWHLICPNSGGTWFSRRTFRQPFDSGRVRHWSYLLGRSWDHRGLSYSALRLAQHVWNYRWGDRRHVLDLVICPSQFLGRIARDAGLPAVVLPHPAPAWPRLAALPDRPGPLRLMFLGRLEPEKGVAEFLRILPTSFDGTLTVFGDGSDLSRCRHVCRERGLEQVVTFLGRRPHAEVARLMQQAHVLIAPSLMLETFAMTVLEALYVGTNILVTDRGAPSELVAASGVGFVFTPGDAASLLHQLKRIETARRDGTLNAFDVGDFLAERDERRYTPRLLQLYESGKAD
jgi:glycosyltransferase involved in cell wall biosynthesis